MGSIQSLLKRGLSRFSPPGRATMVVGMHRSGTSFLTGSLQQAGLELGRHSAWNPHNQKGNRENQAIVAFHDALLARHGCSWDNPPADLLPWSDDDRRRARRLISEYRGVPHWGFKDPRALLVVEGWRELLPGLRFVGIFRHPRAVARSLDARGGMPESQAFTLWKRYNNRLLSLYRLSPFPVLCFDEDDAILHEKLNQVLLELDLAVLSESRFFSPELKHHQVESDEGLSDELKDIYLALKALAR